MILLKYCITRHLDSCFAFCAMNTILSCRVTLLLSTDIWFQIKHQKEIKNDIWSADGLWLEKICRTMPLINELLHRIISFGLIYVSVDSWRVTLQDGVVCITQDAKHEFKNLFMQYLKESCESNYWLGDTPFSLICVIHNWKDLIK